MKQRIGSVAITGAGSGIGKALAIKYAAEGADLHLAGRNTKKLQAVKDDCEKYGAKVAIFQLDVRDRTRISDWLNRIHSEGPIDVVYANAGITNGTKHPRCLEELGAMEDLIATNLTGAIQTLTAASEIMIRQGSGHLVCINSLAGYIGFEGAPSYCASKAGLRVYCESLRRILRKHNVGMTVVFPGYVRTAMSDRVLYSKPLVKSAEKAAELIFDAEQKRKSQYGFPWILWAGVRLLAILPVPVQNIFVPYFEFEVE